MADPVLDSLAAAYDAATAAGRNQIAAAVSDLLAAYALPGEELATQARKSRRALDRLLEAKRGELTRVWVSSGVADQDEGNTAADLISAVSERLDAAIAAYHQAM